MTGASRPPARRKTAPDNPPRPYPRLGELHGAMQRAGLSRVTFDGTNHGAAVRTLFCTDEDPMVLCVAVTHESGTPTCAFEWKVQMPEYRVSTYMDDQLNQLRDALGLQYGAPARVEFKPSQFLLNVLSQAPRRLSAANEPRPSQTHRARVRSEVEEADKVYFIGWRDNHHWNQNVSAANLFKTRNLIGAECADMCARHNISTCWSAVPGSDREPTAQEITRRARQAAATWTTVGVTSGARTPWPTAEHPPVPLT